MRKAQRNDFSVVFSYRNIDFPLFRLCFLSPSFFHALNGENPTPNTQQRIHKTACAFIIQIRNIRLPRTRQLFINIVWAHYLCIVLGNTQSGLIRSRPMVWVRGKLLDFNIKSISMVALKAFIQFFECKLSNYPENSDFKHRQAKNGNSFSKCLWK